MSTTLLPTSGPPRPAAARAPRRRAEIRVRDSPDAVTRVLTTLRRRSCLVVAIDFRAADRHRPGRLAVVYEPPPRCRQAVPAWLANLVDVLEVRDEPA